jgi:hypothetical protein
MDPQHDNPPPSSVIKEFEVIKNEWNRRLALRKFEVAFKIKKGCIKGKPFSLNFTNINPIALDAVIEIMETTIENIETCHYSIRKYIRAAQELANLRVKARKLYKQYLRQPINLKTSNYVSEILADESFIQDAINNAISSVEELTGHNNILNNWEEIGNSIDSLQNVYGIYSVLPEISIVAQEHVEKHYISKVMSILKILSDCFDMDEVCHNFVFELPVE